MRCKTSKFLSVILVGLLWTSCWGQSRGKSAEEPKTLEIGEHAPDFSLPGVDGRNYKLADFAQADILVVIFTCNHCPTAQAYEDRIKKLAADYKNKGVVLVAISPNAPQAVRLDELGYTDVSDSLEEMRIRAKDMGFNFPYLYDGDKQQVSLAYGPVATPHVFIFDKERKLRYVGRVDDSEKPDKVKSHDARNAIEALLAGKKVPVEKTRAFGCSIKWSSKRDSAKEAQERWAKESILLEMTDADGIGKIIKNDSQKLRLVSIWATWCGACVVEFPELVTIHRMYRGRDFELITISADSPQRKDTVLSFLKKQQASCRNYLFNSEDKYQLVEAVGKESFAGIPYTLLIKPGGEIIYRHLGIADPLELRKAIVQYLGRTYK
ncbi:MAG: redoxin family protein [Sedimentisphaerales bacterium]|nr:redoxin family protein [Sedimentisphaerales bacterium]